MEDDHDNVVPIAEWVQREADRIAAEHVERQRRRVELGPPPKRPEPFVKGSAEAKAYMDALQERKRVLGRPGGRPRKITTAEKALEAGLEALAKGEVVTAAEFLLPFKAAAMVRLIAQTESKDEQVAQRAIFRLLEITDGKPAQSMTVKQDGPVEIVYKTEALVPDFMPLPPSEEGELFEASRSGD